MAHKKAGGSSRNGRDSNPQYLGVKAYGGDISFVDVVFINTMVSLFGGLIPVPGGIGVFEAGLTAGLTAFGVPPAIATAAVLTDRLVTAYIPPVFGYFSINWMTKHDYL
jgi:uncharacterized protein (TIRG00374 family)